MTKSREFRIARASKKAYRAMQEFDAQIERVNEVVEETDTDELEAEIRRLAEPLEPPGEPR